MNALPAAGSAANQARSLDKTKESSIEVIDEKIDRHVWEIGLQMTRRFR